MANMFDSAADKIKGSPFVIWVCMLLVSMFTIGLICFAEDAISSRNGIETLEQAFGIKPTNLPIAYWAISLIPQIGQTVLSYMYLMDRKRNWWALPVASFFFLIDFVFDVEDRSNHQFIPLERTILPDGSMSPAIVFNGATIVASAFTLTAYTLGSELFLSVSIGMFLSLVRDGIKQVVILYAGIMDELADASVKVAAARRKRPAQPGANQSQGRDQQKGGGGMNNPVRQPQSNGNSGGGEPHQTPPGGHGQGNRQGNGQQYGQPSQRPQRPPALRMRPPTQDEIDELFDGMFPGGN